MFGHCTCPPGGTSGNCGGLEIRAPIPAESAPPRVVTTLVSEAPPVVVEYVQPVPVWSTWCPHPRSRMHHLCLCCSSDHNDSGANSLPSCDSADRRGAHRHRHSVADFWCASANERPSYFASVCCCHLVLMSCPMHSHVTCCTSLSHFVSQQKKILQRSEDDLITAVRNLFVESTVHVRTRVPQQDFEVR